MRCMRLEKIKEISEYPAIQKKKKNWLREWLKSFRMYGKSISISRWKIMGVEWIKRRCVRFLIHFLQRKKGERVPDLDWHLRSRLLLHIRDIFMQRAKKEKEVPFISTFRYWIQSICHRLCRIFPERIIGSWWQMTMQRYCSCWKRILRRSGSRFRPVWKEKNCKNVWNSSRQMCW